MNKTLRVFRLDENGLRIPWEFELTPDSVLVRETRLEQALPVRQEDPPHLRAYLADLRSRGVVYELDGNRVILHHIPPLEQEIGKFFEPSTPCHFPGCEALRIRWLEEMEILKGRTDLDCNLNCAITRLRRQYSERIRPLVTAALKQAHESTTTTRPWTGAASAPAAPLPGGGVSPASQLQGLSVGQAAPTVPGAGRA